MAKVERAQGVGEYSAISYRQFRCPGCNYVHQMPITGPHAWKYNGNDDAPTFDPSIRASIGPWNDKGESLGVCHSHVMNGRIIFLDDCTHPLKNQTVDLPDVV